MSLTSTQSFVPPGECSIIPFLEIVQKTLLLPSWSTQFRVSTSMGHDGTLLLLLNKSIYQDMLALAKMTHYVAHDPSTHVYHFLNSIIDPWLTQAKLFVNGNCDQYSGNFDDSSVLDAPSLSPAG